MMHTAEPIWTYISTIRREPKLDREAEIALARRFKHEGDAGAGERLAAANLRHVVSIALGYRRYGLPLADLIAEGNFGLAYALGRFDPERGFRFMTYAAYWIRTYMIDHVIRSWSMVGGGSGALRSKLFFKLRRERSRIASQLGDGEESDALLAERMGIDKNRLAAMLRRFDARDVSFEAELDEGSRKLADLLVAPENQEQLLVDRELSSRLDSTVKRAITELDERERYIVERRLMADDDEELSLAQIGRSLGVSRERARQLEERAKKKLRQSIVADSELGRSSDRAGAARARRPGAEAA